MKETIRNMNNDDDIHVIDGEEYLPEQKPTNVWTTFNPKIQSKITLRKTRLLRKKSMELIGAVDDDEGEDVLHQAVLSPPPRAQRRDSSKSIQIKFRPMLKDMYEEHRAKNREMIAEMDLAESPVHQRRRPWSKTLSQDEINTISTKEFDNYNPKLAVQLNYDFPRRVSTKKYEQNKELVKLIIAEEVRAAKKQQAKEVYLEHKNRLKELKLSSKQRAKLLTQRLQKEATQKLNTSPTKIDNSTKNRRNKKAAKKPLLMIGKNKDKPIYGFRRFEQVDDVMEEGPVNDISNIQLVQLCADIRQNREDNLAKMKKATQEFRLADSEWETMRRDPKYLLGKRFDNLKNEVTNTISGGEEKLVFDPMFEMNEEDFHRWAKLKKEPRYRAHKLIQRRAKEAREKAKNSIHEYQIQRALRK